MKYEEIILKVEDNEKISEIKKFLLTELKANMRFWFRAFNVTKVNELREIEGILFGDSEKNKSPISIKLKEPAKGKEIKIELILNPYVRKDFTKFREVIFEDDENTVEKMERIKVINTELAKKALTIVWDIKGKNERIVGLKWYKNMLELSLILGGVGKGVRRNNGILSIKKENQSEDFKNYLENLIKNVTFIDESDEFENIKIVKEEEFKKEDRNKIYKNFPICNEKRIWDNPLKLVAEIYNKSPKGDRKPEYSHVKNIFLCENIKREKVDKPPVMGKSNKGIDVIIENKDILALVTEKRIKKYNKIFDYKYYTGTRSKLYSDSGIQSPVVYTSYVYGDIKYHMLIVLNNTDIQLKRKNQEWRGK